MDIKKRIKISLLLVGAGVIINIALAIIKMYVGLSTNSLTIMLDATNSVLDILTCLVTVGAFVLLLFGGRGKARFGYGRGEYLASFVVAAVSVVMGGLFFVRSLNRMAMPEPVWFGWESCVLVGIGVPIKLGIGLTYFFANKKLKSKALAAIMLDSFLDIGITATSLIAFTVSSRVDYAADAIFGIVISIVIVILGVKMVIDSVKSVVVGSVSDEDVSKIKGIIEESGYKAGNIELHDYGYAAMVGAAEVVIDEDMAFGAVSAATGALEKKISDELGGQIKIIPVLQGECQKKLCDDIVKEA